MARVYQRRGCWCVDYTDRRGVRIRRRVSPSKREAQDILAKLIADDRFHRLFGYSQEGGRKTWDEMFVRLQGEGTGRIRRSTARRYKVAHKSLSPYFGTTPISSITTEMVSSYVQKRLEVVTPATVNRETSLLRAGLNLAYRFGWLMRVPHIRMLREPEAPTRYFTLEELQRIVAEAPPWMRPAIILSANTGIRLGELEALTWDRVDLFGRTIRVEHTKTGFGRTVPLNDAARHAVGGIPRTLGCALVFNRRGRPWRSILQTFKRACERAGVEGCCWHTLRHTFASHLVMRGVELAVVRELLGHRPTSFRLTLRYAHMGPEKHREAVRALEGLGEGTVALFGASVSQVKKS